MASVPTETDRLSMSPDATSPHKCERWRRFGAALELALAGSGKTQTAVARKIGVSTSTLSAWKLGQGEPDRPDITFELEREVGVNPGELSVHLGYVPAEAAPVAWSWQAGLVNDPEIDDRTRQVILAVIQAMQISE